MLLFKPFHFYSTVLAASFLLSHSVSGTIAPQTPNVAVHETHYGIELAGTSRQSVESISVRIYSHSDENITFIVQCFFLKRGKPGIQPSVDDTVIFEVPRSHSTYEVTAKPIKLSGGGKKSGKSSTKSPPASDYVREGFIVRILCDGKILRLSGSNHPLDRFAKEHPELLDQAAAAKTARHPQTADLLKK